MFLGTGGTWERKNEEADNGIDDVCGWQGKKIFVIIRMRENVVAAVVGKDKIEPEDNIF